MDRKSAEDFIYESYLKASEHQSYGDKDKDKRHPEFTKNLIEELSVTDAVVITGSKGKGSVAKMLSTILETYYRVGLMTSPHILTFNERFRINGEPISDESFVEHMEKIAPKINEIMDVLDEKSCVSPMGIQAALALSYFNSKNSEFNIFECGKGAQFDDVNNIPHKFAIINSIFLEHRRELGDTIADIAFDKAHVITGREKCVFVGEQSQEALEVIKRRAKEKQVKLKIYGRDFEARNIRFLKSGMNFDVSMRTDGDNELLIEGINLPLLGRHQAKNCALAMAAAYDICEYLKANNKQRDEFSIDKKDDIKARLSKISWPGRLEVIAQNPFTILDACINRASCENVKEAIKELGIRDYTLIIGIPDDKDYLGVTMEMVSSSKNIILTKSQNPHYVFTEKQISTLNENGIKAQWTSSSKEAVEKAIALNEPIVILGTTSLIAEIEELYKLKF